MNNERRNNNVNPPSRTREVNSNECANKKHRNSQLEWENCFIHEFQRNKRECCARIRNKYENQILKIKEGVKQFVYDYDLKFSNMELEFNKLIYKCIQNENNKFAAQIEQLESALKESDRKLLSLQRDFEDCKEKLKHSQKRNSQLRNENGTVKTKSHQFEEIAKDCQLKMEKLNSSNEKLKLELSHSENKCTNLLSENNQYLSEIDRLKLKIKEIDEENKNFQNMNEVNQKLQEKNDKLLAEMKKIQYKDKKHLKFRKLVPPIGFNNPKGYCYLNCVIQVLASCDDFKKDIEKSDCSECFDGSDDSIFVKGLICLLRALGNSDVNSLKESLNIIQQYITESSFGDDVYKCFMNILSRVSKVIKTNIQRPNTYSSFPVTVKEKAQKNFEKFKNKNPGLVFDNFYGQLTFQMTCDICAEICNESFQVMKSLTLAVPKSKSKITLERCINLFFSVSKVNVQEPLKCGCPKGSQSLKSTTKLIHGPKYLFIYLNRGSYTDNGAKIDTFVTCSKKSIEIKDSTNNAIKYRLISVIDHVGNTFSGHYYCRSNFEGSDWWLLNDAHVEKCRDDEVVTKNAIVFLFKREIYSAVM